MVLFNAMSGIFDASRLPIDSFLAIIGFMKDISPRTLVYTARMERGLSQRELARKAKTAQSVIARIELGETSPTWDTMIRLLRAAGHTLHAHVERKPTVDSSVLDDVPRILRMTPQQRLEEIAHVSRFVAAARRV